MNHNGIDVTCFDCTNWGIGTPYDMNINKICVKCNINTMPYFTPNINKKEYQSKIDDYKRKQKSDVLDILYSSNLIKEIKNKNKINPKKLKKTNNTEFINELENKYKNKYPLACKSDPFIKGYFKACKDIKNYLKEK